MRMREREREGEKVLANEKRMAKRKKLWGGEKVLVFDLNRN